MAIRIQEIQVDALDQYGAIPVAFEVESLFQVDPISGGLAGMKLREERAVPPYMIDYDSYGEGGPARWSEHFDLSNWGVFLAVDGSCRVGGVTVAFNTPGIHMLGGRSDLAVLWDIRVHPDSRRCGIGTKLFNHAADWSRGRGCGQLKIETQNVNVPACRFYLKQGCELGEINRYGYAGDPEVGHEVMLVWYLDL